MPFETLTQSAQAKARITEAFLALLRGDRSAKIANQNVAVTTATNGNEAFAFRLGLDGNCVVTNAGKDRARVTITLTDYGRSAPELGRDWVCPVLRGEIRKNDNDAYGNGISVFFFDHKDIASAAIQLEIAERLYLNRGITPMDYMKVEEAKTILFNARELLKGSVVEDAVKSLASLPINKNIGTQTLEVERPLTEDEKQTLNLAKKYSGVIV